MRTNELKDLAKKKGFKIDENDNGHLSIISDNQHPTDSLTVWKRYAVVSNNEPNSFSIYDSEQLDDELVDAVVSYARTPIDERKDEIKITFVPIEIDFSKKALNNMIANKSKEFLAEADDNSKFQVILKGRDEFEMLLRILAKVSGTEMWP